MTNVRITRTPVSRCLNCGKTMDSATPTFDFPDDFPDDSAPSPGDIAICLDCAHVHVYANDMTLRAPTDDEMTDIAGDREMIRAIEAIGRYNREPELPSSPSADASSSADIRAQITRAQSAVGALVSLLSHEPELKAAYREAKVAERTLEWIKAYVGKRD